MGQQEAQQLHIALSSLDPALADTFRNDADAMWGFHMAYFGFKGDASHNYAEPRRNLIGFRREFQNYVRRRYGFDFEADMPIDWDLLRAISGAEAPGL